MAHLLVCGWGLALAHAKFGDPAAIAGYLGKSDGMYEAVARFAVAYAEQTDRDYYALVLAAKTKRIRVATAELGWDVSTLAAIAVLRDDLRRRTAASVRPNLSSAYC